MFLLKSQVSREFKVDTNLISKWLEEFSRAGADAFRDNGGLSP